MRTSNKSRIIIVILLSIAIIGITPIVTGNHYVDAASKPAMISSVKITNVSHSSVKISWKKVKSAKRYQVYRKTSPKGKYYKLKTLSSKSSSFTDKSVLSNKKYYYKVRAINGSKKGAFSKAVKATPMLKTPIVELSVKENVELKWNKVDGATSYEIFKKDEKLNKYKKIKTVSSNVFKYSDNEVFDNTLYKYKVRAIREYKKTQYYNSKSKKWQNKKPATKYWKGKKTRKIIYYTAHSAADEKQSVKITDGNYIEFTDDVIVADIKDETSYTVINEDENSTTIEILATNTIDDLKVGDLVVLPRNDDLSSNGVTMEITSIENTDGNYLEICGTKPLISDVVESINIDNSSLFDLCDFEAEEGVVVESSYMQNYALNRNGNNKPITIDPHKGIKLIIEKKAGTSCSAIGTQSGTLGNPFFESNSNSNAMLESSLSASMWVKFNPEIKYKMKNGKVQYLNVDLETKTNLILHTGGKLEGRVRLGHGKLWMPYGFMMDVDLYLVAGVNGEVSIIFEETYIPGVTYNSSNGMSFHHSKKDSQFSLNGNISAYSYLNCISEFQFMNIPIVGAGINGGVGYDRKATYHPTEPKNCMDIRTYPILNMGLDYTCGVPEIIYKLSNHKKIKWELTLLDRDTPFNHEHYENGERTKDDICSHAKEENRSSYMKKVLDSVKAGDYKTATIYRDKLPEYAEGIDYDVLNEKYWEFYDAANTTLDSYFSFLPFDFDNDGEIEVICATGDCEANYMMHVFKRVNGRVEKIGDFDVGHSSLHKYPDENGVIVHYGQMGYEFIDIVRIENNEVKRENFMEVRDMNNDLNNFHFDIHCYISWR